MRITLEVPEHRVAFMLELIHSLPFVTLVGRAAQVAALDETAHLLSSLANVARLWAALERNRWGQHQIYSLPEALP